MTSLDDYNFEFSEDDECYQLVDGSDYESDYSTGKELIIEENVHANDEIHLRYKSLSTDELYDDVMERVEFVRTITQLSTDSMIILLRLYGWNEEMLLENYTENPEEILEKGGLIVPEHCEKRGLRDEQNYTCPICCDDYEFISVFRMECGHEACINCYRTYLTSTLKKPKAPTCMSCNLSITSGDIDQIFGNTEFSKKHMFLSFETFINKHSKNYKWCPYTGCGNIIYSNNESTLNEMLKRHMIPEVACNNKHAFCFHCSTEVHSPSDCKIAQYWIDKVRDESTNLNWILNNTKPCPFCGTSIEKNGGCNHMACQSCQSEFCWICDGKWSIHTDNYVCKFQNEKKDSTMNKSISKRFTDGYKMFIVHENSSDLDLKLAGTIESKIFTLQKELGISWIEGQFLSESIKILLHGRSVLKWSYVIGVFCDPSHNLTHILEQNQTMLSNAVESLSLKIQIKDPKAIIKCKAEFHDASSLVNGRIIALERCCQELLIKGICKLESI
ncbi:unnamed protein product [Kluyveromyces dobzhanskii CBS 2104]|uniref:RBR-type E3 ubiquitin transferase n=1 Tax=Kluyveromyces dobzhanskii CBS 2104 TaxID=1427455 RepID=A0A0A8L3L1_9SACH|nr:unnamed protein product [Kluyveromyces dobzhanskii CBS 2104]